MNQATATAQQGMNQTIHGKAQAECSEVKTYNHAFTLAFSVSGSNDPEGLDITAEQFYTAIIKRAKSLLANDEMLEAIGAPFDSYAEDASGTAPRVSGCVPSSHN